MGLPLKLVHREYISTRIDIDVLITLLDHGDDDSEGFDSAEFVLNHSQRISVVTGTSSVYGVLEETRLTSHTHSTFRSQGSPSATFKKNLETGSLQPRVAWDQISIRAL